MLRRLRRASVVVLAGVYGCSVGGQAETAGAETLDPGPSCNAPPDGLLPAGNWGSESGSAFTIDDRGWLSFWACTDTTSVERAEVRGGAVDWTLTWGQTNDTGESNDDIEGRATGTFCATTADLLWAPLLPNVTRYEAEGPDDLPDICD